MKRGLIVKNIAEFFLYAFVLLEIITIFVLAVGDRKDRDQICQPPYARMSPVFLAIPCWLTEIVWEK